MKKFLSLFLALTMLISALGVSITSYAGKAYAENKIAEIQKTSGFVPGKTAYVTENCYAFVSAVCQRLYGVQYQEGLYNGYQCYHKTGYFYQAAILKTGKTADAATVNNIVNLFVNNALPGDVVHYGSLNNPNSTHTFMIQSIDNEKMVIYHSNYGSDNCQTNTIYWDSFRKNPTSNVRNKNGSIYSFNSLFYQKMRYAGMGVTINRYSNYNNMFYLANAAGTVKPDIKATRSSPFSMKLSWNVVPAASYYQIEYKKATDSQYIIYSSNCTATSVDIKNLQIGINYNFRVKAYVGRWTDYDSVTKATDAPKVSKSTIKPVDNGISISWDEKDGLTGVKISRSKDKNNQSSYKEIANLPGNASNYIDTDVKYGETYYYHIVRYAVVNGTIYDGSNNPNEFEGRYILAKPTVLCDNASSSSVSVYVKGDGNQTEFVYKLLHGNETLINDKSANETTFTIDSLVVGETYNLFVAEKTSVGRGDYGVVAFKVVPHEVSGIKATAVSSGIKIDYNTQPDVDGYKIFRSENKNSGYAQIAVLTKQTKTYTDRKISLNKTYYYKVYSFKRRANVDYLSNSYKSTNPIKYTIPVSAKIKMKRLTPTSINLIWRKVNLADSYIVKYKQKGGKWITVKNIKNNKLAIYNLEVGKTYYFKVRAVNGIGKGGYTSKLKVKMIPPTPAKVKTKSVKKGIKVSYTPQSYASGYMIYRSTKKNSGYRLVKTIKGKTKNSFTDKNVKAGKKYYYKIVCYKKKNGIKYQSEMSKPTKQKYFK